MNPYNNCWSNSVLQVLCGAAFANYLPSEIQCPLAICKHLTKIHKQLHVEQADHANAVRGAWAVSHKMRALISLCYKRDQKQLCMQDDAADLLHLMERDIQQSPTWLLQFQFNNNTHLWQQNVWKNCFIYSFRYLPSFGATTLGEEYHLYTVTTMRMAHC